LHGTAEGGDDVTAVEHQDDVEHGHGAAAAASDAGVGVSLSNGPCRRMASTFLT
jgi:hypothetical protein